MNKIVFVILSILPNLVLSQNLEQIEKEIINDETATISQSTAKLISLNEAIEEGLRRNNLEVLRKYEFQLNELDYQDAFEEFFFPKLTLSMNTTGNHFVENLYRDSIENASSSKTPQGLIGLGFEEYSLFNWGRDYLTYLNSKNSYERTKQRLKEQRRELRYSIIANYFNLSRLFKIVKIQKKQLSHTSFIYRLAKEKISLRKINSQEFLQAKSEFLDSHRRYQSALFDYYKQQQIFADLLADKLKTSYRPSDTLKFKPITIGPNESKKLVTRNQPRILEARLNAENASRDYQRVLKENLPLPKISLRLGTYQRGFSTEGLEDSYNTLQNSRNVEIAASLNMTWTIYGSGGFFNSRVTERAYYGKRIAEIRLKEAHRESMVSNTLTHSRIRYLEKEFTASKAQLKNARLVFDKAIDNYIAGRTTFANMKLILNDLNSAATHFEDVKYEHLVEKVSYASLMGIDDFPGEKFDNLVEK